MQVVWRRGDGTFVVEIGGFRYHVLSTDPLFAAAQEAGSNAPLEPDPPALSPEEALAEWRAQASLTRLQFALQSLAAGLMTEAEAVAFVGPRDIPAIGRAALDLIADPGQRAVARIRFAGAERIDRLDPLITLVKAAADLDDAGADAFFEAGMLL